MATAFVLLGSLFEDAGLEVPSDALRETGHQVVLVGVEAGQEVSGRNDEICVVTDAAARDLDADEADAFLLVGGETGELERDDDAVGLVRDAVDSGKIVATVGHGPRLLVAARVASSVELTSPPELEGELVAAGALWRDQPVVEDGIFVTSRGVAGVYELSRRFVGRIEDEEQGATPMLEF